MSDSDSDEDVPLSVISKKPAEPPAAECVVLDASAASAPGDAPAAVATPATTATAVAEEEEEAAATDEAEDSEDDGESDGSEHYWDDKADGNENYLGEDVWKVEALKGRKVEGGVIMYLVKWEGYPDAENTWEPEENVGDEAIAEYDAKKKKKGAPPPKPPPKPPPVKKRKLVKGGA